MSVQALAVATSQRTDREENLPMISHTDQEAFALLEQKLSSCGPVEEKARWLNDYLDLGLELACRAGERHLLRLQTSWVRRLYQTLRDSALSSDASLSWRALCVDYLYQPYFALVQLYRTNPAQKQQLKYLTHEFTTVCRHCGQ